MPKTKIELESPYNKRWKFGYLNINSDGRKTLTLYNSHKDRSSTQYARYLMAVHLGRFLNDDEHIDHIDNDKTNDSLDNLQILSLADNNMKAHKKPNEHFICPICNKSFERTRTQLNKMQKWRDRKREEITCSRSCGAKFGHLNK